ncbi:phytoene desaturase family protein [Nocardioides massiliensis]|uniref:UDP-galactopyranose mutase n=1 Tax=Nocardioides massiliensis TaxID=1325935 RepID=A0ABT9NSY8_9ACTN|nr:FAD-dependent oxidoreductase [Nocardioides massiliensis]MDP9823528.1 UDP-galactopyranose mutase [Nocardioides massiliensis]
MARVVVIGGGLGGMASAVRLAKIGHEVTLLEAREELGGALGLLAHDGYTWDAGPSATPLPGAIRDLFRKSGRPLEREVELVAVPQFREHRFEDDTRVTFAAGRVPQQEALTAALGEKAAAAWMAWTESFHTPWETVRREYLERPWALDLVDRSTRDLLFSRETLHKRVRKSFKDVRLRAIALHHAELAGHDPRNVPAWWGVLDYVEQKFGVWTVPGGLGQLTQVLTKRLGERRVTVQLGTPATDVVVRNGAAVAVATREGELAADLVVCAVDPRRLPTLARHVARTMPALPPVVSHLGLGSSAPDLATETVFHREPTIVVRRSGVGPDGTLGVTLLGRGRVSEDIVVALARYGLDLRPHIVTRVDENPRQLVERLHGSPYGVAWQGRRTLTDRLSTRTPIPGVFAAGAHAAPGAGVPFVALSSALIAQEVGPA